MAKSDNQDYRDAIADSWERCGAWKLDHDHEPSLPARRACESAWMGSRQKELLECAAIEVLPYYRNVLSKSRCLILLADSQATVLEAWGDGRVTEAHLQPWFKRGANWQERTSGTNAIGTSIAVGEPIQVQRNEHFLKVHRSLIGSAAPVFDSTKTIMGVLSVFSDAYLPQAHTLGVVRLLSQSVENRLIQQQIGHGFYQITLNTTADNFDSPWCGILFCDDSGHIVACNQRADQLLNCDTLQANLSDLFRAPQGQILNRPEASPFQLMTRNRVRLSARLRHPVYKTTAADEPATPPHNEQQPDDRQARTAIGNGAAQDAFDLNRLEYGDVAVQRCADQALKVLKRGVPVLITGETGVGKEVLVKALHSEPCFVNGPLIAVNCAAIPPELVESELFGYQAGAFTGARAQGAMGLIRKADKGLLFLDEIGEMPLSAQSRLLRVLQERVVMPVGSAENIPVDFMLITATNRSLVSRIESGQFRADLYYRINGLSVELPALRHRTDRAALIQEIYQRYRDPSQDRELSPQVLAALVNHPWPGNIRQLLNVLRAAIAIGDGDALQVWHLPEDFLSQIEPVGKQERAYPAGDLSASRAEDSRSRQHFDRLMDADEAHNNSTRTTGLRGDSATDKLAHTLQVYRKYAGNISAAARELAISRNTLYKRLRQLGIR